MQKLSEIGSIELHAAYTTFVDVNLDIHDEDNSK